MGKLDYEVLAVGKEIVPIRKEYSPEEIEKMQREHTMSYLVADKKTAELKAHNDVAKGEIKAIYEKALNLRNAITLGSEEMSVEAFMVPDFETGMMNYINPEDDTVVFSRRLTPSERQLRENKLRVAL